MKASLTPFSSVCLKSPNQSLKSWVPKCSSHTSLFALVRPVVPGNRFPFIPLLDPLSSHRTRFSFCPSQVFCPFQIKPLLYHTMASSLLQSNRKIDGHLNRPCLSDGRHHKGYVSQNLCYTSGYILVLLTLM